jgi:hypothetical protein
MTVAELLERTTSLELSEWYAYFSIGADKAVQDDLKNLALARLERQTRRQ